MRRPSPIVLVVAPTPVLVRKTLAAYGLTTDGGEMIRMVTRCTALRGWHRGMPVLAADISQWSGMDHMSEALGKTLLAMLADGRLRIAQESDIQRVRQETLQ